MRYLGDYAEDAILDFFWNTSDAAGASTDRATDGEIRVYKGNSLTQTTTGITDDEAFDGLVGVHHCRIVLTDSFYIVGEDYAVVLAAATIDGEAVNAVIAHFSIENRNTAGDWTSIERENIRFQIGVNGTQTAPTSNTPNLSTQASVNTVDTVVDTILVDTADMQPTVAANLNATVSSRATPAQVNTEIDNALDTAIPITPTADSVNERLKQIDENPNTYKADVSALATEANATANKNAIIIEVDANEAKIDTVDTVVDAIKVKTDNLPSDPTSEATATTNKDSIITEVNANEAKIDTIDTVVDAILVDTSDMQPRVVAIEIDTNEIQGKLPANFIMGSSVTADKDDEIDAILVDTADMQPRVAAIEIDTNQIQGKLPTNFIMGSSVVTDKDDEIDAILADTNETQEKLPTNNIMGSSVKTDKDDEINAIKAKTDQLTFTTGNVHSNVQVNSDKTDYTLTSADKDDISDRVHDEVSADHTTVGTTGEKLNRLDAAITTRSDFDETTDPVELLDSGGTAGTSADELVTDIWGNATRTLTAFSTSLAVSVWDVLTADITIASTIGILLKQFNFTGNDVHATLDGEQTTVATNNDKTGYSLTVADKDDIVDRTWDETLGDHLTAGSTGRALKDAEDAGSPSQIADAVWDEILSAHQASGTGGEFLTLVKKALINRLEHDGTIITLYDDNSITPLLTTEVKNKEGVLIDSANFDSSTPVDRAKLT